MSDYESIIAPSTDSEADAKVSGGQGQTKAPDVSVRGSHEKNGKIAFGQ